MPSIHYFFRNDGLHTKYLPLQLSKKALAVCKGFSFDKFPKLFKMYGLSLWHEQYHSL